MIDIDKALSVKESSHLSKNNSLQKMNFEKMVYAFKLLELLDEFLINKHYVFKGGTSLLVLFGESSRLSIDVDIEMDEEEYENETQLESIFKEGIRAPFRDISLEPYQRSHGGRDIKCSHFMFSYEPVYATDRPYILLDINYTNLSTKSNMIDVKNDLIPNDGAYKKVNTIEIDDLFSEKLVAFAPNTVGVKYESNSSYKKYCEIIKQLFDCAYLSDKITDLDRVAEFYKEVATYQISLEKDKHFTLKDCLKDTINTCELILSDGKFGDSNKYKFLLEGLTAFNNYKIGLQCSIVDLRKYALKVLIITSRICEKLLPKIKRSPSNDYFITHTIPRRRLEIEADKNDLDAFYKYCLLDI